MVSVRWVTMTYDNCSLWRLTIEHDCLWMVNVWWIMVNPPGKHALSKSWSWLTNDSSEGMWLFMILFGKYQALSQWCFTMVDSGGSWWWVTRVFKNSNKDRAEKTPRAHNSPVGFMMVDDGPKPWEAGNVGTYPNHVYTPINLLIQYFCPSISIYIYIYIVYLSISLYIPVYWPSINHLSVHLKP